MVEHLKKYGFITKTPEPLNGYAALGLRLMTKMNSLWFSRWNRLLAKSDKVIQREIFAACWSLAGQSVVCSFIKRKVKVSKWDDQVSKAAVEMVSEVIGRVKENFPVKRLIPLTKDKKSVPYGVMLVAMLLNQLSK